MAQRVQILLEDDVDGTEASETVVFGLDGRMYEIDLSAQNSAKLRDAFTTWTNHARPVKNRRANGSTRTVASPENLNKVREWGRANGFKVNDRGRVSAALREAYSTSGA